MKSYNEFLEELEQLEERAKAEEKATAILSALKNFKINGYSIETGVHAAAQAFKRAKNMTVERWKEFFKKVTNAIDTKNLSDGHYLFYSRKAKQGVIMRLAGNLLRLITTLPPKKSIAKPGTTRMMIEGVEEEVHYIEID